MQRFDVTPILRAQWRSLVKASTGQPDYLTRSVLVIVPAGAAVLGLYFHVQLASGPAMLAGLALLAGALISAFTHLSTLRATMTTADEGTYAPRVYRQIDETAAHLLSASTASALDAGVLAVGLNIPVGDPSHPTMHFVPSAIAMGLSSYVLLIFLVAARRMYAAYIDMNKVTGRANGFIKGARD